MRYPLQSKTGTDYQLAFLSNQRTVTLLFSITILKFILFFSHLATASEIPAPSHINQPAQPHNIQLQAAQDIPLNSYSGSFKLADLKGKLVCVNLILKVNCVCGFDLKGKLVCVCVNLILKGNWCV